MTHNNVVFTIIKINPDLSCSILHTIDTQQSAIHYLTKHINTEYELDKSLLYKVYQKSETSFDVYKQGYVYKSLECKLHIVTIDLGC